MARLMLSALLPAVFSAAAFALLLVMVTAGTNVGDGQQYYLISLNTSKIGTDTVKFTPATTTSPSVDDPTGILSGLLDGLSGIANSLTGAIDNDITELESSIVTNLTQSLGIHDVYNMYLHNICEVDYKDPQDTSSGTVSRCPPYSDKANGLSNFSSNFPSYVVVGTTNISIPLLATAGTSFEFLQDTVSSGATAIFALDIVGLISSFIVLVLSVVAIFLPRIRLMILVVRIFAFLAPLALLISAVILTVLTDIVTRAVNNFGSALTISASTGMPALTVGWVSWALSTVSFVYWFLVWFVSYRRTSFARRIRTESQIGNWKGIVGETMGDLRVPREKTDGKRADLEKGGHNADEMGKARPERADAAAGQSSPYTDTRGLLV